MSEPFSSLPLRPSDSLVDDRVAGAVRRLTEALIQTPEYQAFVQAARAVSQDAQVTHLTREIRACRASFGCADSGKLQAELQTLPVMAEYARSMQALAAVFNAVDRAVSAAAGVAFIANVRPDGHG